MWQVLLAAAVAGYTGLLAQHFLNPFSFKTRRLDNHPNQQDIYSEIEAPIIPLRKNGFLESGFETTQDTNDRIFWFSSSGSGENSGSRSGSRASSVNFRVRARRSKKKASGGDDIEKRFGGGLEVNKGRASVCLKKRRTVKNAVSRCRSCSNRDNSLFSSGLGAGIMYMMSTGISEINKLNAAMDETANVVQELKNELYRRSSMRNTQVPVYLYGVAARSRKPPTEKNNHLAVDKSRSGSRISHDVKLHVFTPIDDGEYPSSVLTEEPEPEMVEMDQLETELESELQKLNLTNPEDDCMKESQDPVCGSESYQCDGILASELDKRLCHLLIQQQENQIQDLESEVQAAQSKLQQKETELQALKDCVRRLTEFSLSNSSDDETDPEQEQDFTDSWNQQRGTDSEQINPSVGMKRHV